MQFSKQPLSFQLKFPSIKLFILLTAAIGFCFVLPGVASAAQLTITSQAVARGSVTSTSTAGQDYVVMQAITMQAGSGNITVQSITINDYGNGIASNNVASASLYKETNGVAGFQSPESPGMTPDALIQSVTYPSNVNTATFTSINQTIGTNPSTFYIVYNIKGSAQLGQTVGTRITDQNAISVNSGTVASFANLQSNLLTIVSTPHSSYSSTTSLCETCHMTHLAPDFSAETTIPAGTSNSTYRVLNKAYSKDPDVVNNYPHVTYNLLCEACHDGTGASTNIKAYYDGSGAVPGHFTKHVGNLTYGWNPPPANKQYNAGVKIPCGICHDIHGSAKGNYKILSDGLYNYEINNGWVDTGTIGKIDNNPGNADEKCVVCHEPPVNSTTQSSRTGVIMGIDMKMPITHNTTSNCEGCHKNTATGNAHDLDLAPNTCSSCHLEITTRMTSLAGTDLKSSHMTTSTAGNLTFSAGTCTGMCHSNHIHSPTANNIWSDAINHTLSAGPTYSDWSSAAPYGLCLSCHTSTQPGYSAGTTVTAVAINAANYNASAHQYQASLFSHSWDLSSLAINCLKCHRDSEQNYSQSKYGPHGSRYLELSFAGVDPINGYVQQGLCYTCHATNTTKNPNGAIGKDFYNAVSMSANALNIDNIYSGAAAKAYTHPTYTINGDVSNFKMPINETGADFAAPNNRHAECVDCHDEHAAKAGTHTPGSNAVSGSLIGAIGEQPASWPNGSSGNWANDKNPTSWAAPAPTSYEWQLCLKCHSTYTTQPTNATNYPWGANSDAGISANQQTNQALEFNPNNAGYHAVVGASKTSWGTYLSPWANNSQMYCSDCHKSETSTDPAGPHGANNAYILTAPFSANTGGSGTDSNLCFKCHDRNVYGGGTTTSTASSGFSNGVTNLHNTGSALGQGHRQPCIYCHTFIPHGWKKSKMLVETGDQAPYNNGSKLIVNTWSTSGNWQKISCDQPSGTVLGCH